MTALDELATELDTNAIVGGSTDWKVELGILSEDNDEKTVAILEVFGDRPETEDDQPYDYPGFEFFIRGDAFGYEAAHDKAQEVFNQIHDATLTNWAWIYATGTIQLRGYDRNNRPILQLNFESMRKRL